MYFDFLLLLSRLTVVYRISCFVTQRGARSRSLTSVAAASSMRRVCCYTVPTRVVLLTLFVVYTYIQSRFYRSPEVILGMNYHMAIDMWSLGCILAELYTGLPIFPGENEQEQLSCIMEILGVPDKDFVNRSQRKRLFFGTFFLLYDQMVVLIIYITDTSGAPRPVVSSKGRRRRPGTKSLAQVLRTDDELFLDFISKCLVWDPERRIKPQAALRHPFITAGRRPKPTPPTPSSTARSLLQSTTSSFTSSRSKHLLETPKKSLISAPTPLTARSTRVATGIVPNTPGSSSNAHASLGSASRSYRSSQPQTASYQSSYGSSRTLVSNLYYISRSVVD